MCKELPKVQQYKNKSIRKMQKQANKQKTFQRRDNMSQIEEINSVQNHKSVEKCKLKPL